MVKFGHHFFGRRSRRGFGPGHEERAILRAHGAHHSRQSKEDCDSFGLLLVNLRFFRQRAVRAGS